MNRWTVQVQGIHPPERLIYLNEVELKKLRQISQRGFGGDIPQEKSGARNEEQEEVFEDNRIGKEKIYKYEATNIGYAYDSRYWSWVRVIGYYRSINEEESLEAKIEEARKLIKG